MTENGARPEDVILLCDENEDRRLFLTIRTAHPLLAQIPEANVRTYDQARSGRRLSSLEAAVTPLHQDDRPDWIFCLRNSPVVVTELTKHAYTGDNGLQRFARFAAAAENGVPFIYFGPLKRVRDDELDGDRNASPRRLTSNLFEGMQKLSDVLDVPQLYVEWVTDRSGLPASLPFRPTMSDIRSLYGTLLDRIALLLFESPLCTTGRPLDSSAVASAQQETAVLAQTNNTRDSDVQFWYTKSQLAELLSKPSQILSTMVSTNYFAKGKPDKALAEYALSIASVNYLMHPDGKVEKISSLRRAAVVARLLEHPKFSTKSLVYYTGYKWRSDPHCGALVNVDYRLCRQKGQVASKDRKCGLIVVYPRVSVNASDGIGAKLASVSLEHPGGLKALFEARYGAATARIKMASCLDSDNLFGSWSNSTKQARIFRRYADVVVLNDGLVLGEALTSWLK